MSDSYEKFEDGDACIILVSTSVLAFLAEENVNDRQHVLKVAQILRRLAAFGPINMNNTEQFRNEGKFPSGKSSGGSVSVYVVKAHQLRVYGGFARLGDKSAFFCVEGARKRKPKADPDQLKRVAKSLGDNDER